MGPRGKAIVVTVVGLSVAFLAMGIEPWRVLGCWATVAAVILFAHVATGGTGGVR